MISGRPRPERALAAAVLIYLLCFLLRAAEYFWLRTDQTVWGEAFVHKLLGIGIMAAAAWYYGFSAADLGFARAKAAAGVIKGLLFGLAIFALAYLVEIKLLAGQGEFQGLSFYVSAYAVDGNVGRQTAIIFFIICILGNIINVIMEAGLFRGLFIRLLEPKYSFLTAVLISSLLFGLWHIMAPIRSYCDGALSLSGCLGNMAMLAATSAIVGCKFVLLTRLTGSLYMAMGDHFVNNTIVNMLHVVSGSGADRLMVVRISIAQAVSVVVVLLWYFLKTKRRRPGKI